MGALTVWEPSAARHGPPERQGTRPSPEPAAHMGQPNAVLSSRVSGVSGIDILVLARVRDHVMRTYSGRPSSSIWFSTAVATATSVACRPYVCERSPSPMRRFRLETSASTRARQLYPKALCQTMRPRSAVHLRCASRCVGADCAASLGAALARGGTTKAASGWRAATSPWTSSCRRPHRR